jgi:hypothetical protein
MTRYLSSIALFVETLIRILWLSVSSPRFYQDVLLHYKGYGIKYILNLAAISSVICTIIILNYTNIVKNYLDNDIIDSYEVRNIDHIINQLPNFNYDGKSLAIAIDQPLILSDLNGAKIVAIDPLNKLTPNETAKIPISTLKDLININLLDSNGNIINSWTTKYEQIFGTTPQIITKEKIKSTISAMLNKVSGIIPYTIIPVMTVITLFVILSTQYFLILALYIFFKVKKTAIALKDCIRVVMFSNGIFSVMQFIPFLAIKELNYVLWALQMWPNILMIIGIIRLQNSIIR